MKYNRKSFKVTVPAAAWLVDLTLLKSYVKADGTSEDDLLTFYIKAASLAVDRYCNRYFINTTVEYTLDGFGEDIRESIAEGFFEGHKATFLGQTGEIDLPFRPISSVTSIKTYNPDNTEAVYSSANYRLDGTGGRIYLNEGATWPTDLRSREAVKIVFVSGFGAAATDVPFDVRQAALLHAAKMYECRDGCDMTDACKSLLNPYRLLDGFGW